MKIKITNWPNTHDRSRIPCNTFHLHLIPVSAFSGKEAKKFSVCCRASCHWSILELWPPPNVGTIEYSSRCYANASFIVLMSWLMKKDMNMILHLIGKQCALIHHNWNKQLLGKPLRTEKSLFWPSALGFVARVASIWFETELISSYLNKGRQQHKCCAVVSRKERAKRSCGRRDLWQDSDWHILAKHVHTV